MKKLTVLLTLLTFFLIAPSAAEAQFLDKLMKHAERKVKNEAERRSKRRIDKKIDKSFDEVEDTIDGKKKKKKKTKKKKQKYQQNAGENQEEYSNPNNEYEGDDSYEDADDNQSASKKGKRKEKKKKHVPKVVWSKFDFVPGDEVIFEDAPSPMEENGEFPSRWDLISGQVEIAEVDGETVMMFLDGGSIVPYLKNANEDYLPDVFTIEFDFYRPKDGNRLSFYLKDRKNQRSSEDQEFEVFPWRVDAPDIGYVNHPERDYNYCKNGCWTHISLAYTKGKLKVYIDDTRVVNVPHYKYNPTGFTFNPYFASAKDNQAFYAKNFRIAKGGVKYYDRVLQDGKIIVNGIRFDVGKTTLKPESMGPINKIYKLMSKKPDLKFSVEGHTDADGDDTANQTLSEGRAQVVMDKLVAMGISQDRLSSKGWGESKPIAGNDTPEGKANNRRVEFVVVK